ncbi:hypothetical protein CALCODRAFT_507567 [Calocera cornea HHB12733]|uniref:Uncharacterized protein n=1 Tax=Calocera cornea HHB12733 TaxID=1353952 RepID=A0A165HIY8_9BASI|nr:hypothetical protein CALCODRAFT_507567 [Calocera cornea HHB12733]
MIDEDTLMERDMKPKSDIALKETVTRSGLVTGEIAGADSGEMTIGGKGKELAVSGKAKERARAASMVPPQVTASPSRSSTIHHRTAPRTSSVDGPSAKGGEKRLVQSGLSNTEGVLSRDAKINRKRKRDETTIRPETAHIHGVDHLVQPVLHPFYEFAAYIPAVQEELKLSCDRLMNSMLITNAFPDVYLMDDIVEEAVSFANAHSTAKHGIRCTMLDLERYPGEELLLRRHVMEVPKRALEQAETAVHQVWAMLFDLMDCKYEGEDLQAKALEQRLFKEGLDLALSNASFIYRDFNPLNIWKTTAQY